MTRREGMVGFAERGGVGGVFHLFLCSILNVMVGESLMIFSEVEQLKNGKKNDDR